MKIRTCTLCDETIKKDILFCVKCLFFLCPFCAVNHQNIMKHKIRLVVANK